MPKLFPNFLHVQIDDLDGEDIYRSVSENIKDLPFEGSDTHPIRDYRLVRNYRINIDNELLMLKALYLQAEESIRSRALRDDKYITDLERNRQNYNKLKKFIIEMSLPNDETSDLF